MKRPTRCKIDIGTLEFLGHTTHQDLHDALQEGLKSFDMGKMVQLAMDAPNVNLKLLQKVKDSRDEFGHSKLIDCGSCNLHTVHGSFKTGAEASGWSIKQLLKSCHQILKDSPARRDDFYQYNWVFKVSTVILCNQVCDGLQFLFH